MTYFSMPVVNEVRDMSLLFWKRKKRTEEAKREAKIQSIHRDTLKKINEASRSVQKVRELLDRDDITLRIFYATGGDKRDVRQR